MAKTKWDKIFKYPNGTLKNKLNIHDSQKLATVEFNYSTQIGLQIYHHHMSITSLNQLQEINKTLFGWLYPWAGKFRTYTVEKPFSNFLDPKFIPNASRNINGLLKTSQSIRKLSKKYYANLLFDINTLHPFREGNGRTTKIFLQMLAFNHHQNLQYDQEERPMIQALNDPEGNHVKDYLSLTNSNKPNFTDGSELYINDACLSYPLTNKYKSPYVLISTKYRSDTDPEDSRAGKYVTNLHFPNGHISHTQVISGKTFNKILGLNHRPRIPKSVYLKLGMHNSLKLPTKTVIPFRAKVYRSHISTYPINKINESSVSFPALDFNLKKEIHIEKLIKSKAKSKSLRKKRLQKNKYFQNSDGLDF